MQHKHYSTPTLALAICSQPKALLTGASLQLTHRNLTPPAALGRTRSTASDVGQTWKKSVVDRQLAQLGAAEPYSEPWRMLFRACTHLAMTTEVRDITSVW